MAITVKPAATVKWTNEDDIDHTLTSTPKAFNSGHIAHATSGSHTFTKPGGL
jgi:plastocyanin